MLYLISMKRPPTTIYRLTLSLQFAWTPQELTVHDASKTRKIDRIVFVTRFFRSFWKIFCMSYFLWYMRVLKESKYSFKWEWFWNLSHNGLFTLDGTGIVTIGNNGSWSLSLSWTNGKISASYTRTHWSQSRSLSQSRAVWIYHNCLAVMK